MKGRWRWPAIRSSRFLIALFGIILTGLMPDFNKMVAELMEKQYDEIYKICQQGNQLLN